MREDTRRCTVLLYIGKTAKEGATWGPIGSEYRKFLCGALYKAEFSAEIPKPQRRAYRGDLPLIVPQKAAQDLSGHINVHQAASGCHAATFWYVGHRVE